MLEILNQIDTELFLFLNSLHSPYLDPIMYWISGKKEWILLYLYFAYLLIKQYGRNSLWLFVGIGITITLCDQVASGLMKPFFERLRPSHEPDIEGLVHIVNDYRGGMYGFASSHAANAFGLATFLWLTLRTYYRKIVWVFLWATVVAYSRIYLGVHYPGDIIVGGLLGLCFGFHGKWLSKILMAKFLIKRKE